MASVFQVWAGSVILRMSSRTEADAPGQLLQAAMVHEHVDVDAADPHPDRGRHVVGTDRELEQVGLCGPVAVPLANDTCDSS